MKMTIAILGAALLTSAAVVGPASAEGPAAAPVPPKELDQLKPFLGSWTCAGRVNATDLGPAHPTRSTVSIRSDLDGFWYMGSVQEAKTPENPHPLKGEFRMGYDGRAPYVLLWVDNLGGWSSETSRGWQGDTLVFEGEANISGEKTPSRDKFTKKADESLVHSYEFQLKGQWTTIGEESCQKAAGSVVRKP